MRSLMMMMMMYYVILMLIFMFIIYVESRIGGKFKYREYLDRICFGICDANIMEKRRTTSLYKKHTRKPSNKNQ